jgi:hypothetical protein
MVGNKTNQRNCLTDSGNERRSCGLMNSKGSDMGVSGLRAGKLWKLPRYGNPWKNKKHFPTCSHSAWKTLRKKRAVSFPQFPQLRRLYISLRRDTCERHRSSLCTYSQDPVPELRRKSGLADKKSNCRPVRRSLFLTSPFIEPVILLRENEAGVLIGLEAVHKAAGASPPSQPVILLRENEAWEFDRA